MKIFYFLIILASIFIVTCKKKDDQKMNVSGQVIDPFANKTIDGINVELYAKKIESGIWNGAYTIIQSAVTDNYGNFNFDFDVIRASNFKISLHKSGYFDSETEINPDNVVKGSKYHQQYIIHSLAYLKITFHNSLPSYDSDRLNFRITKGFLNASECCWDSSYTFTGKNINIVKKCKVYGSQKIIFEWNTVNNNHQLLFQDSIYCNPFDTASYTINY